MNWLLVAAEKYFFCTTNILTYFLILENALISLTYKQIKDITRRILTS